jgi:hypothetical protein
MLFKIHHQRKLNFELHESKISSIYTNWNSRMCFNIFQLSPTQVKKLYRREIWGFKQWIPAWSWNPGMNIPLYFLLLLFCKLSMFFFFLLLLRQLGNTYRNYGKQKIKNGIAMSQLRCWHPSWMWWIWVKIQSKRNWMQGCASDWRQTWSLQVYFTMRWRLPQLP